MLKTQTEIINDIKAGAENTEIVNARLGWSNNAT